MSRLRIPFRQRLAADQSGAVLPIAVGALVVVIALVGAGLDLSVAYMARNKLQNACDSAALAGRQIMAGNVWDSSSKAEARKYFDFNFPAGTHGATEIKFDISPNPADTAEIRATASASIPTSLMRLFKFGSIPVSVACDAKRDLGQNDIALVLDTTGSMNDAPSGGGGSKISRLRTAALSLYTSIDNEPGSMTRFAIIPYSHTVNVAGSLANRDFLLDQSYVKITATCSAPSSCTYTAGTKTVNIVSSTFAALLGAGVTTTAAMNAFRLSGKGCIEERPSVGEAASPIRYLETVTADDVDERASGAVDKALQFGRYDPDVQEGEAQSGCPSEATRLQEYTSLADYTSAINAATANVTGGTYHDMGMLWGLRFISRDGFFKAQNAKTRSGVPVRQHIVFMTDGKLDTGDWLYSGFGLEYFQKRLPASSDSNTNHVSRFLSACNVARAKGITVWVIALDVTDTADIAKCASSPAHFYTSDGSNLDAVFAAIGQGIGNLRLTR